MENFTIYFNDNDALEKYLERGFLPRGVYAPEKEKMYGKTAIKLSCDRAHFRSIVADALVVFCKTQSIQKQCPKKGDSILYHAYLGTLVGDGFEEDKKEVERALPDSADVYLNGILHFRMTEMEKKWLALGELAQRLYSACREEEDVYALIKYFLGNGTTMNRTLIVDNTVYFDDNNTDMNCLDVSDVKEDNIAFNLLLRRPQEIVILTPKKYDERLSDLVRKLGQ